MGHENKLKKEEEQHSCLLWENEDEATQHVLQWGRDEERKQSNISYNTEAEWNDMV